MSTLAPLPFVYKICSHEEWQTAVREGAYRGSADDRRDGFIHLSLAHQVPETARKYFSGRTDLVLVRIPQENLGDALRFEVSRGGDRFPHLYDDLIPSCASQVSPLPWNGSRHDFGGLL